jgi:hypothetical protein
MIKAPPKFKAKFAVAESRYDDFVSMHVNATRGGKKPITGLR